MATQMRAPGRMHSPVGISLPDKPAEGSPGSCYQQASVLRFDHVNVSFDDKPALSDISFEMKTGETIVLFGATGSGKTVLLKTAIGLIQPGAGQVYLLGRNIGDLPDEELFPLRQRVGMLFQEGALFDSLTVEENLAYPLIYQRDRQP